MKSFPRVEKKQSFEEGQKAERERILVVVENELKKWVNDYQVTLTMEELKAKINEVGK